MGSTTEERSQGRAARTRQRIVATARAAFAAKGYDGTNLVGDVLEPAGVSAGSFYHQFRSKSDLYHAVVQEASVGWQGPLESLAQRRDLESIDDLVDVARSSYSGVFEAVDQNEDLVRIQMRDCDHPDPEVCEPLRAMRAGWIATVAGAYEGLAANPAAAAAAAEVTVALALGAIALYLDTPLADRAEARRRLTENLSTFTLGGLFALDQHHRSQT